jgi:phosphoglycolate phosphatase-like HAD superfamily hydrolase
MKVLALDFDGVIANSIWDCFFTGFNVYLKFNPGTHLLNGEQITYENFERIKEENLKFCEKYIRLASFASSGKHFVVVFYIIERMEQVKSQLEFDIFCAGLGETTLSSFQSEFYVERNRLQAIDMEKWYALTPPFFEVVPVFKKLIERDNSFLVTSRDKDSAVILLKKFGFNISEDKIISKDYGLDKVEKLTNLVQKMNVGNQNIIFVDDLIKHVMAVKQAGFDVFMSTWGYSTKEQQAYAEQQGVKLITQENFDYVISSELEK